MGVSYGGWRMYLSIYLFTLPSWPFSTSRGHHLSPYRIPLLIVTSHPPLCLFLFYVVSLSRLSYYCHHPSFNTAFCPSLRLSSFTFPSLPIIFVFFFASSPLTLFILTPLIYPFIPHFLHSFSHGQSSH